MDTATRSVTLLRHRMIEYMRVVRKMAEHTREGEICLQCRLATLLGGRPTRPASKTCEASNRIW